MKADVEANVTTGEDSDAFVRRYIRYLRLAFLEKVDNLEYMESQVLSNMLI